DEAMAKHRTSDAIDAWETAARWYLPGAPHVDAAYERLAGLARELAAGDPWSGEPSGRTDPRAALSAWRAVRSAALATRNLWTPHAADLAEANAAIAELSADD